MHNVFNVSLLKKYFGDVLHPPPVEVDGKDEYEIEKILSHRRMGKGLQFLIRWKGYDASEDSWLSEKNLQNASVLLNRYKSKNKLL